LDIFCGKYFSRRKKIDKPSLLSPSMTQIMLDFGSFLLSIFSAQNVAEKKSLHFVAAVKNAKIPVIFPVFVSGLTVSATFRSRFCTRGTSCE
jgi:hypothetical protein